MRVLITGANGFIGRNARIYLAENPGVQILQVSRSTNDAEFLDAVARADAVIHLAGVNRPVDAAEFASGNPGYTARLCDALRRYGNRAPIAFASSTQADNGTPYGESKRFAEERLLAHAAETGAAVAIHRLPNVFGKWSRPNYNSVVATFCHNIARDLPIRIDDAGARVNLLYIDDLLAEFRRFLATPPQTSTFVETGPVYATTVGELAAQIAAFRDVRSSLMTERVGEGLLRALYATYVSYLPVEKFSYCVPSHADARGLFVEMLKTRDSGQFSFFTAHPGVVRGGHYHHSKTEKFLVVRGHARFRFRRLLSGEVHELETNGDKPTIVETIPGWIHDIANVGNDELIVMLWANEVFDRERPDTVAGKVEA